MVASANPSGNNQKDSSAMQNVWSSPPAATNIAASNSVDNGGSTETISALKHNPGIATVWTHKEQCLLEDLLSEYVTGPEVVRYAKIAMKMKNKTVRDIALRCRWMAKKENCKPRKEDHSLKKSKDKKEKATDSSANPSSHLNVHPYGMMDIDTDDVISYKVIGGVNGHLLEQNSQIFNQVSSNFSAFQVNSTPAFQLLHENVGILCNARDNILAILNNLNDIPEVMKQMLPLPVKVNEELANLILPHPSYPMKS